jgi:hypothetical protein
MLMVSKGRRQYSKQQGDLAEKRFIDACEAVGYQVRKATAQEDIYEHIDYWVLRKENWYGVDVKGNRHPETIWVEGWLHGSATFIAFDIAEEGGFAVILREELVDWCLLNVDNTFVGKNEAYRKLYQREGREDVLTKIHLTDLKELNSFKLLRYATT